MLMTTGNDLLKLGVFAEDARNPCPCNYDADAHITNLHADWNGSDTVQQGFLIENIGQSSYSGTADTTTWYAYDVSCWLSTKYTDDESGLNYYGYRYYSPSLGRWLSRDPIGELGGLNVLVITGNNPINYVDAVGFSILDSLWAVLKAMSSFLNDCASLPKNVDSPIVECPSIQGAYKHCWNNCMAMRCAAASQALNPLYNSIAGAIALLGIGWSAEQIWPDQSSVNDLIANANGILNAFNPSGCGSSCVATAEVCRRIAVHGSSRLTKAILTVVVFNCVASIQDDQDDS